ncbi:hypothetical protein BLNAU_4941 [Blattamonas nauphoetae]|uniref:Uncharacterized protein n=1 Tax=Blattamonas nauphoetae TaxID=2049346 RepID=A0ABQ9Y8H1_9EUKA|nr:hypothetical protein BLNAU_4941 [Blattamonas nauphoetae]
MTEPYQNQRVYLKNVPVAVTEKELVSFLTEKFGQNSILQLQMLGGGSTSAKSERRFINYIIGLKNAADAELLIQQSPINLSGVEIVVSPYNPSTFQPNPNGPAGTGIGAGGIAGSDLTSSAHHILSSPRSVVLKGSGMQYLENEEIIRTLLSPFGKIVKMNVSGSTGSQRTAFVEFEKDEEARNCERGLNGKKVCATGLFKAGDDPTKAGDIICEKNNTHTTLYVRGFRPDAKDKLRELFNHYGNVIECLPHFDNGRTWANVVMEDMSQAQRAISQIHMQYIDGYGKMFVELFVPKNQRMKKPAPQGAFMGMPQMPAMNQPGNPPQYMMPPMGQYPMMPYGQNMMGGYPMQYNYMNPQMAQQMPQQGYPPQQQGRGQMGQQRYQNRQPRNSAQNQPRPTPNPQPQQTQISSRNFPPFDKTELANKSEDDQKQTIGEYIYPIVLDMYKSDDYAGKITGILIEFPLDVLVRLVGTPDQLQKKIHEAYGVLKQTA